MATKGTRKFNGITYYLVEREVTKTAAKLEASRLRKSGQLARITQHPVRVQTALIGRYSVWSRKK